MFSFKSIVLIATAFAVGAECSGVPVAAALAAPAHIGYAHGVPQNIPPYASQVSVTTKALSPLVAAPVATPFAAPVAPVAPAALAPAPYFTGPAPYAVGPGPYVAGPAPYITGPGPYVAGPAPYGLPAPSSYTAAYAAPFPYGAPFLRSPYGLAPAFVR